MKYLVIIAFVITFILLMICLGEIKDLHARVQKLERPDYIENIHTSQSLEQGIDKIQKCVDRCG